MKHPFSALTKVVLLSIVAAAFSGCGKLSNQIAPGMTGLSFQGTAPGSLAAIGRLMGLVSPVSTAVPIQVKDQSGSVVGTLNLSEARVALKEIKIKLPESELDTAEKAEVNESIKFKGPYVLDLLANSISPALPPISLAAGSYSKIQLKLDKIEGSESDDVGAPLVNESDTLYGKSIYLAGTYTGNTASGAVTEMPFVLSFELDEEFDISSGGQDLAISSTEANVVIVAFRLAKWFAFDNTETNDKAVDFTNVTPQADKIELSDSSDGMNQKVWEVIRKALKHSADFGKDADEDGKLGTNEDDDPDSVDLNDN